MSGKTHTASYNSQNQLTKYDDLGYTYDADGNRVSVGSDHFVYDHFVYDHFVYDDNGHLLSDGRNTYVYGASGVIGYYDKDNKFVTYLFNQRGDVIKETDESGSVINSFEYNDYGKLTSSDKAAGSVFGYGGQYGAVTDKNGLVFLRTRYYNPEIMRFMNRDTVRGSIVDTKSLNRFAYVEGNPLTYVDPNGQAATWLKNNWVSVLQGVALTGISIAFPEVGFALSILSIGQDLSTGNYAGILLDSFSIFVPFLKNARTISTSENMTRALAVRPKYEIALRSDVQDIDLVAKGKPDVNVNHANIGLTRSTVTDIDKHVNQVSTDKLPSALAKTYADSAYDTVETTSDVYLYRVFGKGAGKQGAFATTRPAQDRIQSKIDSALVPSWKNSREYEAKIKVPAGTRLNVGKVEQQTIKESGTVLNGGADQILLPQGWPEDWITEIRGVRP